MEYPAVAHSCLLCDKYFFGSSRKTQIFSPLAFKSHLLSEKHLAVEKELLELKKQKRLREIKNWNSSPSNGSYTATTIGEIRDNGKLRIFVIGDSR